MFKRLIASLICLTFSFSNFQHNIYAQDFSINQLPIPGTMVGISSPFTPLTLKGLVIDPQKPLEFQFIVATGHGPQDNKSVKDEATQLVKYFLAGLTIPEGDLWVNLSPYEKDRIVPVALGQTDLGRDLLAQDYILKQLTASLIYPEKTLGKEFWGRVYQKAQEQFGTTNVPVNTFNKVWILPNQAQVFENGNAAYVTKSTLRVMLDEDYLAKQKHQATQASGLSSQVVREIVLPEIEKEVNIGKNFAPLRQIYQALILAKWYKETIQNGLLNAIYINKKKITGVNLEYPAVKEQIYARYLQAYKKGVFNYIKEDRISDSQAFPKKYFSGGAKLQISVLDHSGKPSGIDDEAMETLQVVLLVKHPADLAMQAHVQADVYDIEGQRSRQQFLFNDKLKEMWDERAGFLRVNPADYQRRKVNVFGVMFHPTRVTTPILVPNRDRRVIHPREDSDFVFTKAPVRTRLMDLELNGMPVTIIADINPLFRWHFLLLPELLTADRLQKIEEKDILATLQLADISANPHLKFFHNSFAAGGEVNNLHIHGVYYPELQMPIEHAKAVPFLVREGLTISQLEGFSERGFLFEGENEKIARSSGELVKKLQDENIPYDVLMMRHKVYILPRTVEDVKIGDEYYSFGALEMAGDIVVQSQGVYDSLTFQEISKALVEATIIEEKFDELKSSIKIELNRPEDIKSAADQAMFTPQQAIVNEKNKNGGIDLNQINLTRTGKMIKVQFDQAQLNEVMQGGFEGFTPFITSVKPIQSPMSLLGVGPVKE